MVEGQGDGRGGQESQVVRGAGCQGPSGPPAGIAAAVSAGYLGHKVALYEPLVMIGGMGAAGNLALHDGSSATSTFTGLAQNFTMLNAEYYGVKRPVAQPESFVANASFWKMLANAGVTKVELNCRLTGASVGSTKASVQSISVLCEKDPVTATVFIDGRTMVRLWSSQRTPRTEGKALRNTTSRSLAPVFRRNFPPLRATRRHKSMLSTRMERF